MKTQRCMEQKRLTGRRECKEVDGTSHGAIYNLQKNQQ